LLALTSGNIDIVRYNTSQQQYIVRGQGNGHGVNVYQHNSTSSNQKGPWLKLMNILDPLDLQDSHVMNNKSESTKQHPHQFGIDLATHCDGSIVAISGTSHRNSYTRIYQESSSSSSSQWNFIGEIQGVRYGGSIKLNAGGTRLVMGTVASEGWRGIVQVFDRIIQSGTQKKVSTWTRVWQPIVGAKPLEMWGGDVELSRPMVIY
jgi:hypothetical protein